MHSVDNCVEARLTAQQRGKVSNGGMWCSGSTAHNITPIHHIKQPHTVTFAPKLWTYACHGQGGNQLWKYDASTGRLAHKRACVTVQTDGDGLSVALSPCIEGSLPPEQKWQFKEVPSSKFSIFEKS